MAVVCSKKWRRWSGILLMKEGTQTGGQSDVSVQVKNGKERQLWREKCLTFLCREVRERCVENAGQETKNNFDSSGAREVISQSARCKEEGEAKQIKRPEVHLKQHTCEDFEFDATQKMFEATTH